MEAGLDALKLALANGGDAEKIAALRAMRERVHEGEASELFDLARTCVANDNSDIRWQAFIVLGGFIPLRHWNEKLWTIIEERCDKDEDTQEALATVLLEHLLEHDFDRAVERLKSVPSGKTAHMGRLLNLCWQFGQSDEKWHQLREMFKPEQERGPGSIE